MIINAPPLDKVGIHWLLFAQAGGQILFADPLGKKLYSCPFVYKYKRRTIHERYQLLMKKPTQSADSVFCGLYCIYVAHVVITNNFLIDFSFSEFDSIRVAKHI